MVLHGASPALYQSWLETLIRGAQARPFLGEALV
jgi:hypothetical protein